MSVGAQKEDEKILQNTVKSPFKPRYIHLLILQTDLHTFSYRIS